MFDDITPSDESFSIFVHGLGGGLSTSKKVLVGI